MTRFATRMVQLHPWSEFMSFAQTRPANPLAADLEHEADG